MRRYFCSTVGKELVRTQLSKSVLDVAWGPFITILEVVAVKRGIRSAISPVLTLEAPLLR